VVVTIALVVVDFIAKICFGFIGWHLRWRVLRGEDGKVLRAGKKDTKGNEMQTMGGNVPKGLSREVLLCSSHDDYVSVVLRTKLAGVAMQVTMVGNTEDVLAKLDKEADRFAFVIVSLPMLRFCNGEIAQHAAVSARSPRKILPLITYTQQINDEDFSFIRSLEVGLYELTPPDLSSKAPGFNPCTYQVKTRFQSLLSNATCTATSRLTISSTRRSSTRTSTTPCTMPWWGLYSC
jgi:hypothetical protein